MLLHDKQTDSLVEVLEIQALVNPVENKIKGSRQSGEEEQPPEDFAKERLNFPSGEELPRCWVDANYREVF